MMPLHLQLAVRTCEECGKLAYGSRKAARRVARTHTTQKNAYRCPIREGHWHVGGLHPDIVAGNVSRRDAYAA